MGCFFWSAINGHIESEVVAALFVYALMQSSVGDRFSRALKRSILKGWKKASPDQMLDRIMHKALGAITADVWNWIVEVTA